MQSYIYIDDRYRQIDIYIYVYTHITRQRKIEMCFITLLV